MGTGLRRAEYLAGFEITEADTVVDVGCGHGGACVFAGKLGADVIATDPEPLLIGLVEEKMRDVPARSFRGIVSDTNPLPLDDGTATVVICSEVLEHVDDPASIVAELVRIGRPGARYLLTVPDPVSEAIMKVVAPSWYFEKPIHQRVFTREQFQDLIWGAGLEIDGTSSIGFYESVWWFFRMAIGMKEKYEPAPPAPILQGWEKVIEEFLATPVGMTALHELNKLIPKSQVVIARKPAPAPAATPLGRAVRGQARRVKRWIKSGAARLGPVHVSWKVRRHRADAPVS